jgi:hypothetical protein
MNIVVSLCTCIGWLGSVGSYKGTSSISDYQDLENEMSDLFGIE